MTAKEPTSAQRITNYFFKLKGWDWADPKYRPVYSRWHKVALSLLKMADSDPFVVKAKIDEISAWAQRQELSWNLSTIEKRWLESHEIEKKPFSPDGDELVQKFGHWKAKLWDGREVDYNGSEKDIVWK